MVTRLGYSSLGSQIQHPSPKRLACEQLHFAGPAVEAVRRNTHVVGPLAVVK